VTSLLVRGEPGTDEDELTDRVAAVTPDGIEVISGKTWSPRPTMPSTRTSSGFCGRSS
jgi:hypothetical protein